MTPDDAFLARMRQDPGADPKRVAREAGISGRAARRLLARLETEGVVRTRSRRRLAAGAVLAGAVIAGVYAVWTPNQPAPHPLEGAPSHEARAKERELYLALDRKDPARVESAVRELSHPTESVRLAALRYLATVSLAQHVSELVALFDDPSDRVRPVALQLVGHAPGREVEAALVGALRRDERPLAERLVAVSCLRDRRAKAEIAPELLPVLLDDSRALRDEVSQLLAQLTGQRVDVDAANPEALHAAWRQALAVTD